ncbi:hypothetical protein AAZX31_20G111800 [Glycine max]
MREDFEATIGVKNQSVCNCHVHTQCVSSRLSRIILFSQSLNVMSFAIRPRSEDSADVENPGNNLYVTGLSTRITDSDLH